MPSRYFFNRLARSQSPRRKSRAQLAREKAEIERVFAPSFPNGLPEPYLWKVTHRHRRPSKKYESSPKGDRKDANGGFTDNESVFKMGNMFERPTDDSESGISMGQDMKDPSLAPNINYASGSRDSSLNLEVIESVEEPSLVLEVKNGFSKENDGGEKKAQAHKQQVESSPAFLTTLLAGRSKTPASPKQSPKSLLIGITEPPKDPCSKAAKASDPSTDPDHLGRSKFPSGKRLRMTNYLKQIKVAIGAKPPSVRNSALVRSAASLRHAASYNSRYATHLPGLVMNGDYQPYRSQILLWTVSLAPRPIPQIIITPPPPEGRDSSTNAVIDFNSLPSPSLGSSPSPITAGTTAEVPVSEAQPLAEEGEKEQVKDEEEEEEEKVKEKEEREEEGAFDQKLARILESYIDSAKFRNELRREIYKLFAEEKGIITVCVSAPSS